MSVHFRKIKIGHISFTTSFAQGKEKAVDLSEKVVHFLEEELKVEVVKFIEPIAERSQAIRAWKKCKAENVDGVILFNGTFSSSDVIAEIARNLDCPFVVWGLGELALDTKDLSGSMIGVMAAGTIFKSFGKKFTFVYGPIEEKEAQKRICVFVRTIRAIAYLKEATLAIIGMRPNGFQVVDADELAVKKLFGTEIINISTYRFSKLVNSIDEKEVNADVEKQKEIFAITSDIAPACRGTSRIYLALKKIVREKNIQAYAPECWPEFRDVDETPFCPANSRMVAEGIMAACECDVDGALTMMLGHMITGESVFFADFTTFIEKNNSILFWHCGNAPHDLAISKPNCEKIFGGVTTSSVLKSGLVTVCRLNSINGEFLIHGGKGQAVESELALKGSNIFIRMDCGNKKFAESLLENGIPHHNVIVYGDIIEELKEFAKLMNIPVVICT